MNISEMHVWFRQYAQQMGMQNVRGILPEQIDMIINTSITDIVTQKIKENIGTTYDRSITDNSKLGQINELRTLYKVLFIDMAPVVNSDVETRVFNFNAFDRLKGRMTTNFDKIDNTNLIPDYMVLVDFSLSYKQVIGKLGYTGKDSVSYKGESVLSSNEVTQTSSDYIDYVQPTFDPDGFETNFFPVRIIDEAYLSDTINDFVLKNKLQSPIIVAYNNNVFDLYIDKFNKVTADDGSTRYVLKNDLIPYKLKMAYIAKPAIVKYVEKNSKENIDCDLPENVHIDILKHAVDLFNRSIEKASLVNQEGNIQQGIGNNYLNRGN